MRFIVIPISRQWAKPTPDERQPLPQYWGIENVGWKTKAGEWLAPAVCPSHGSITMTNC